MTDSLTTQIAEFTVEAAASTVSFGPRFTATRHITDQNPEWRTVEYLGGGDTIEAALAEGVRLTTRRAETTARGRAADARIDAEADAEQAAYTRRLADEAAGRTAHSCGYSHGVDGQIWDHS